MHSQRGLDLAWGWSALERARRAATFSASPMWPNVSSTAPHQLHSYTSKIIQMLCESKLPATFDFAGWFDWGSKHRLTQIDSTSCRVIWQNLTICIHVHHIHPCTVYVDSNWNVRPQPRCRSQGCTVRSQRPYQDFNFHMCKLLQFYWCKNVLQVSRASTRQNDQVCLSFIVLLLASQCLLLTMIPWQTLWLYDIKTKNAWPKKHA